MKDQYVEVLVKRKTTQGIETIKKVMLGLIIVTFLAGYVLMPLFFIVSILLCLIYYFKIMCMDSEFEYYYLDGELDIAQIFNKSRRKAVLNLRDSEIVVIAPCNSKEIEGYGNLEIIDCSENNPEKPPYAMICKHKNVLIKVYLQLNDNFLKALKQDMPYKVRL